MHQATVKLVSAYLSNYTDARCREQSMMQFHGYECHTKSQLAPMRTDHYYLAMRMVIRGWDNVIQKYLTGGLERVCEFD